MSSQFAFAFDLPAPLVQGRPVPASLMKGRSAPACPPPPLPLPSTTPATPSITPSVPPTRGPNRHQRRTRTTFGRYRSRRRPAPLPKPFAGYGAYRLVVVRSIAHVIGPAGKRCEELTSYARHLLAPPPPPLVVPGARPRAVRHDPFAETRRIGAAMDAIRMLLDAINWVYPTRPKVLDELLDSKPASARYVIGHWLDLRGCHVGNGRGSKGGKIVTPPSGDVQWEIGVTLSRFTQLFDHWEDVETRSARNPMKMDATKSRLGDGETKKVKKGETRWWLDVDGLFRTRAVERQAPRPDNQDAGRGVLERGREMGWPEEVQLVYEGMHLMGARIGQLSAATVYGLLVADPDETKLKLIQKGSQGALAWTARMPKHWREKVLDMLNRRTEGGLAHLRKLAKSRNPIDRATLRSIYIFSSDGRAPVPSWKLTHLLRVVVEDLGLCFMIGNGAEPARMRWFTSHWFRHLFVNRILDMIAAKEVDESERERARAKVASYMGWKHPEAMLKYYGRFHFEREVDLLVAEHQDGLNGEVWEELGIEAWSEPANDNGIFANTRVSGGDLLD